MQRAKSRLYYNLWRRQESWAVNGERGAVNSRQWLGGSPTCSRDCREAKCPC